jgi:hypothetical protein
MISIGNTTPIVWMPTEGITQIPSPELKRTRPNKPFNRAQGVAATVMSKLRKDCRVWLNTHNVNPDSSSCRTDFGRKIVTFDRASSSLEARFRRTDLHFAGQ